MRMLVDVSSVCWTSLLAGKDTEYGRKVEFEGKQVLVNSAGFGYENALNMIKSAMDEFNIVPSNMIFVIEGLSSKIMRQMMMPSYKSARDNRPEESYDEFNKLKEDLVNTFLALGAQAVSQDGIEADDVIAYLAQTLQGKVVILTRDGDLLQLVNDRISVYRDGDLNYNKYGPFPFKFIHLYKATVGDPGDCIKGAYKFGEKAFLNLCALFGEQGLAALEGLIQTKQLDRLAEDVHELPVLQKLIDEQEGVYQSYKVAKLYPEFVNTMNSPLQWRVGMVKPLSPETDQRLKRYAGQARLVHAANYDQAMAWAAPLIASSPVVTLDIETSTPKESDEWLAARLGIDLEADNGEDLGVDVFGSYLVGMSITFGDNGQYTLYLTHKHRETDSVKNLTKDQMRKAAELIPKDIYTVIQNVSFELTVLYQEWAEAWKDNGYHGFVPNAIDTAIMSSYVDENLPKGLKENSKLRLNYEQQTFEQVTTLEGDLYSLPPGGRTISTWSTDQGEYAKVRYKMHELTAKHVFHYGCDDTICTMALYNHYKTMMEIENTWDVFLLVEQDPSYLGALAYVQGVPISYEAVNRMEMEDNEKYNKAWTKVRAFLLNKEWPGTVCPKWMSKTDYNSWLAAATSDHEQFGNPDEKFVAEEYPFRDVTKPSHLKEAFLIYTGKTLESQVRLPAKLAAAMLEVDPTCGNFAKAVEESDHETLTNLVKQRFVGEPVLDIDSSKAMRSFFYDTLGLPPKLINKLTPKEREKKKELAAAVSKWNKIANGSSSVEMTPEELRLIRAKAKTDAFALKWALKFDATPEQADILNAIQDMATVSTRRSLYYHPYKFVRHWKDGLVHANANQSSTVTRRYSFSGPNWQQLPKKGEGIKFRQTVIAHLKDALVGSIDFSGQELRLMAGQSGDANMMSCYVGDKKKDIHSITAAGAMEKKWTPEKNQKYHEAYAAGLSTDSPDFSYDLFVKIRKSDNAEDHKEADDLRKDAKNVNFAAQFDAMAKKLSEMLTIPLEDAQAFLDAKYAMFPDVETWKDAVRKDLESCGYVTTMLGARRHLRDKVSSKDKWEAERAGRQGPNFKIQGSAAEMTKLAMGRLWRSGVFVNPDVRFYFPVHDELVWSAHKSIMLEVAHIVHEAMTQPYSTLPVPILGSVSVGPDFGRQVEADNEEWEEEKVVTAIHKATEMERI